MLPQSKAPGREIGKGPTNIAQERRLRATKSRYRCLRVIFQVYLELCDTDLANMPQKAKNSFALVLGTAIPLLIVGLVLSVLFLKDVRNDRKHILTVNAATPVFMGTGGEGGCHGAQIMQIEAGAKLAVRRIRYLKDCATLDVALPDGREGYVVLGVGDVSVNPPLPTI